MRVEPIRHERAPISPNARHFLCIFAAGDINKPLPKLEVDWQEVFDDVCKNGLVGLTHRYLSQHKDLQDYPPITFREQVHNAARLEVLQIAIKYKKIHTVFQCLNQSGLEYLVVKGPAVACTIYPERGLRPFADLDLIVRELDWSKAHQALLEMGFIQVDKEDEEYIEVDCPNPPPKIIPQAVLYELKYWHPRLQIMVEVHFDDILNSGLASRDLEGFWARTRMIEIDDMPVNVMSLEDQLIHLCMHLHYHGYHRLNAFSDIAFIVRDKSAELDWEQFLRTVRVEETQTGVYYTLYFLQEMVGVAVPANVLEAIRPGRLQCWWHDRFMPPQKIMSMQPMWRPDFSFYFYPLFKRTLPDLLVMGRRKEKLHYLLKLLGPPKDWLRHYYNLDDTQNIALHYFLHPLKIGYHYLVEIAQLLFGWLLLISSRKAT